MNKTVKKVFILVAILVGIFIAWQLIFNDGGILKTGYNALADGINGLWEKVAGDGETILVGKIQMLIITVRHLRWKPIRNL